MSWLSNLTVGMPVEAEDGPVGSIASIPRVDLNDPTSQAEIVVLANQNNAGPGVEEFLRVPRTMIDRVDSNTLYLNVPRRDVPRASASVTTTQRLKASGSKLTIPVSEEVVEVTPRTVELGYLRVQKKVDEYLDEQTVRLQQHDVQVERIPVDQIIDEPIAPYMDGDVYVVPVIEEEVVIHRRLRLKEEVRIHRTLSEFDQLVQTPFLRERVVIEEHRYDRKDDPVEH